MDRHNQADAEWQPAFPGPELIPMDGYYTSSSLVGGASRRDTKRIHRTAVFIAAFARPRPRCGSGQVCITKPTTSRSIFYMRHQDEGLWHQSKVTVFVLFSGLPVPNTSGASSQRARSRASSTVCEKSISSRSIATRRLPRILGHGMRDIRIPYSSAWSRASRQSRPVLGHRRPPWRR